MADVTGASANTPIPSAASPATNGNGATNGAPSPAVVSSAPAAAASPASAPTPTSAQPPRPAGGMTEAQKQEMVKSLSPDKIANFKKVSHAQWVEVQR